MGKLEEHYQALIVLLVVTPFALYFFYGTFLPWL